VRKGSGRMPGEKGLVAGWSLGLHDVPGGAARGGALSSFTEFENRNTRTCANYGNEADVEEGRHSWNECWLQRRPWTSL